MSSRTASLVARRALVLSILASAHAVFAQQSASYKLTENVLNAGGHPEGGTTFVSASHRISLDAIGEGVLGTGLSSASFRVGGGFVSPFSPPGEVQGLRFSDKQTLEWDAEPSVGAYDLYRDLLSDLSGLGYGDCLQSEIASRSAVDATVPAPGQGFFYLVTAENRLDEEGTKGFASSGAERGNPAPCP